MKKGISILIIIALLLGSLIFGYRFGQKRSTKDIVIQRDTIVVTDTIIDVRPIPVTRKVIDTIRIPYYLREHDTVYVPIPLEQKIYSKPEYYAVISGYSPSLDTISVFPKTEYISSVTTIAKPQKWTVGVTLGPSAGIGYDGRPILGVSLTLGIQRAFILNK